MPSALSAILPHRGFLNQGTYRVPERFAFGVRGLGFGQICTRHSAFSTLARCICSKNRHAVCWESRSRKGRVHDVVWPSLGVPEKLTGPIIYYIILHKSILLYYMYTHYSASCSLSFMRSHLVRRSDLDALLWWGQSLPES